MLSIVGGATDNIHDLFSHFYKYTSESWKHARTRWHGAAVLVKTTGRYQKDRQKTTCKHKPPQHNPHPLLRCAEQSSHALMKMGGYPVVS